MLGRNGKVYVWRKPDERFRLDCHGQLDDFETFWGCITYYGIGTLVAIDGFSRRTTHHVMSLYEQISGKKKMEFVPFFGPHKAQILILSKMCGQF
jgi:hypothetical protein